jgi:hypothetical protein
MIDIIVSHYNENLHWIEKINFDKVRYIYLYTKSDIRYTGINPKVIQLFLPNIGREAHTYLYHCINNRNNLADYNLFLQGNPGPDNGCHGSKWRNIAYSIFMLYLLNNHCCSSIYGKSNVKNFKLNSWNDEILLDSGYSFHEWFIKYVDPKLPSVWHVYWEAYFSVSKEKILSRPIEYYESILNQLSTNNTEVTHFLERSWYYVFDCHKKEI